jgi:hypothetical protein
MLGSIVKFPDFAAGLFERAIAAGHGPEDVAALVKVLRAKPGACRRCASAPPACPPLC